MVLGYFPQVLVVSNHRRQRRLVLAQLAELELHLQWLLLCFAGLRSVLLRCCLHDLKGHRLFHPEQLLVLLQLWVALRARLSRWMLWIGQV
jgi:hypothetical protein